MQALEAILDAVADRAVARLLAELPRAAPARAPLLDQGELAKALKITVRTVYSLRQKGCPVYMIGDSPRFDLEEVREWLRKQG
jgi:excisionase family DNA binding protein